jgi:methionyl aminopeptidase
MKQIKTYHRTYLDMLSELPSPHHSAQKKFVSVAYNLSHMHLIYDVNHGLSDIVKEMSNKFKEGADIASIDRQFLRKCHSKHLYPSTYGHEHFPRASCISVNDAICHAVPYPRNLKDGDIVTFDVCAYNGIHSDMAQTYCIGKVSGNNTKLVSTTQDCLEKAISICRPGAYYKDIGKIIEKMSVENGFSIVKGFGGHGIGRELHMKPKVSNNYDKTNVQVMKLGETFCIEPILTTGNGDWFVDDDGFGIYAKDGKSAAHFERNIIITDTGCEILNYMNP